MIELTLEVSIKCQEEKKLETYLVNTAIMQFKISKGVAGSRDISMV